MSDTYVIMSQYLPSIIALIKNSFEIFVFAILCYYENNAIYQFNKLSSCTISNRMKEATNHFGTLHNHLFKIFTKILHELASYALAASS